MSENKKEELYYTLATACHAELVIQRSRFLACAAPAMSEQEARAWIERTAAEHPKARHCCWAYTTGYPDQPREYYSDAGEPSGTAGAPISAAIHQRDLHNCAVAVVRYFGGVKLGVRGLIDAYRSAASAALDNGRFIRRQPMVSLTLRCPYNRFDDVSHLVARLHGSVCEPNFSSDVSCRILVPRCHADEVRSFCSAAAITIV